MDRRGTARPGGRVYEINRVAGLEPDDAKTGLDMAKTAQKKTFKVTAASKRRSRGEVVKQVALATDLKPGKVKEVFGVLTSLIAADLSKKGVGEFNFLGLMKLKTVNKPKTAARKGRNPFTGEDIMIKAKPASRKVRVRALRSLNGMIG